MSAACEHRWRYFPTLDTNPEHSSRECVDCGRVESKQGPTYGQGGIITPGTDWRGEDSPADSAAIPRDPEGLKRARMEEAQKCLYAAATLAHTHGKFKTAMKFEEARLGLIEYEAERAALAVREQPLGEARS